MEQLTQDQYITIYNWFIERVQLEDNCMPSSFKYRFEPKPKDYKLIYLCGKVTGEPYNDCCLKFENAENALLIDGYKVVNPMKIVPKNATWEEAMKLCITELVRCDGILLLPDVNDSKGAYQEFELARELKIKHINIEKYVAGYRF